MACQPALDERALVGMHAIETRHARQCLAGELLCPTAVTAAIPQRAREFVLGDCRMKWCRPARVGCERTDRMTIARR
jgi:hypothetical protein